MFSLVPTLQKQTTSQVSQNAVVYLLVALSVKSIGLSSQTHESLWHQPASQQWAALRRVDLQRSLMETGIQLSWNV